MDGNLTANSSNSLPQPPLSLTLTVLCAIAAGACSLLTILGNSLVMLSFALERSLRHPSNYYIISLAASDFLIGLFSMPLYTMYLLLNWWPLGETCCVLWLSMDYTVCLSSQYTVFFITVDRFCSVRLPARYRNWRTERKIQIIVAIIWVIPTIVFFTSIIGWKFFTGKGNEPGVCIAQFSTDKIFNTVLVVSYYWLTLIVMIVLYIMIYRVALDLQRKADAKRKKVYSLMSYAGQDIKNTVMGVTKYSENENRPTTENDASKSKQLNTEITLAGNNTTSTHLAAPPAAQHKSRKTHVAQISGSSGHPNTEWDASSSVHSSDDQPSSQEPPPAQAKQRKTGTYAIGATAKTPPSQLPEFRPIKPKISNHHQIAPVTSPTTGTPAFEPIYEELPHEASCVIPGTTPDGVTIGSGEGSQWATTPQYSSSLRSTPRRPQISYMSRSSSYTSEKGVPFDLTKYSLMCPPECLLGIRYIDSESIASGVSTDTIRLLTSIYEGPCFIELPTPCSESNGSPVWRRRGNFKSPERRSLQHEMLEFMGDEKKTVQTVLSSEGHAHTTIALDQENSTIAVNTEYVHYVHDENEITVEIDGEPVKPQHESKAAALAAVFEWLVQRVREKAENIKTARQEKKKCSKSENRARKALRTITLILGAFVVCWTPYHVLTILLSFQKSMAASPIWLKVFYFSYWLCYSNSPINPFCYAFSNQQFKKTFLRILKGDLSSK